MNTPRIETNRLILRQFTRDDLQAFFDIYKDEKVNTFLPWFPLQNLEEARVFLEEHYLKQYALCSGYHYAVCLKQDHIPIGYVNVSADESHDFGYGLRQEFWHQGIISEAASAVIEQLRKDGVPYITATHDIQNPRSGAVMQRVGMSYQYTYEELWQPKNKKVFFRMYQLNLDGKDRVYDGYWQKYPHHFRENIDEKSENNQTISTK